jgi:cytidyltransferase-like protein
MKRIYCDGIFDLFHLGHLNHFKNIHAFFDEPIYLIVGIISDIVATEYKRKPVVNEDHRFEMISAVLYVNETFITDMLVIDESFINTNNIDYVVHAFCNSSDKKCQNKCFECPIKLHKFIEIPYNVGISTTEIINSHFTNDLRISSYCLRVEDTLASNDRDARFDLRDRCLRLRYAPEISTAFSAANPPNDSARDVPLRNLTANTEWRPDFFTPPTSDSAVLRNPATDPHITPLRGDESNISTGLRPSGLEETPDSLCEAKREEVWFHSTEGGHKHRMCESLEDCLWTEEEKRMSFSSERALSWKEIWEKKGSVQSDDLYILNGWEETAFDPNQLVEKMVLLLNIKSPAKIMEYGCGSGMLSLYLKDYKYYGLDYSTSLTVKHIKLLNNIVFNFSSTETIFKNKYFDYVIINSMLEYLSSVEDLEKTITEIERIAEKGIYIANIRQNTHIVKKNKHIYSGVFTHLTIDKHFFENLNYVVIDSLYDKDRYDAYKLL